MPGLMNLITLKQLYYNDKIILLDSFKNLNNTKKKALEIKTYNFTTDQWSWLTFSSIFIQSFLSAYQLYVSMYVFT